MYGQFPFGPYGPQQPQVIYLQPPVQPNYMPPTSSPTMVKPPKTKTLSAKRIAKIAKSWNDLLEEAKKTGGGGGKPDDKKDKKFKDHMFNLWDTWLLLCVFSLPVATLMLMLLKGCTLMLKTILASPW